MFIAAATRTSAEFGGALSESFPLVGVADQISDRPGAEWLLANVKPWSLRVIARNFEPAMYPANEECGLQLLLTEPVDAVQLTTFVAESTRTGWVQSLQPRADPRFSYPTRRGLDILFHSDERHTRYSDRMNRHISGPDALVSSVIAWITDLFTLRDTDPLWCHTAPKKRKLPQG